MGLNSGKNGKILGFLGCLRIVCVCVCVLCEMRMNRGESGGVGELLRFFWRVPLFKVFYKAPFG